MRVQRPTNFESLEQRLALSGDADLVAYVGPHPIATESIAHIRSFGDQQLIFSARLEDGPLSLFDRGEGKDLWLADEAGNSHLVKDVNVTNPGSGDPIDLVEFGRAVYFRAYGSNNARGLFRTDGTPEGTIMLSAFHESIDALARLDDRLIYSKAVAGETSLWAMGLTGTSQLVATLEGNVDRIWANDNRALIVTKYFQAPGSTIYFSDGTIDGTKPLQQFDSPHISVQPIGDIDQDNYFLISTPSETALWSFAPDRGELERIIQLPSENVGSSSSIANNELLFFLGRELWKSDGTADGTGIVNSFSNTPSNMVSYRDRIYFFASGDRQTEGRELWSSDGTDVGTYLVKDIGPDALDGVGPTSELIAAADGVYFTADDGRVGMELWKSDGTVEGTMLVKDLVPGRGSSEVHSLTVVNDQVTFAATNDAQHFDIWTTNGTAEGTIRRALVGARRRIANAHFDTVTAGDGSSYLLHGLRGTTYLNEVTATGIKLVDQFDGSPSFLEAVEGAVFVGIENSETSEVWRLDAANDSLTQVEGATPTLGSNPRAFIESGGFAFFATDQGVFRTDGTLEGTEKLLPTTTVRKLAVLGDTLLTYQSDWSAAESGHINFFNLTTDSVKLVADVTHAPDFTVGKQYLYYRIDDASTQSMELWRIDSTDGDSEQLVSMRSIKSSTLFASIRESSALAVVNERPYFVVNDGRSGPEVWTIGDSVDVPERLTTSDATGASQFSLSTVDGELTVTLGSRAWVANDIDGGLLRLEVPPGTSDYHRRGDKGIAFVNSAQGRQLWVQESFESAFEFVLDISQNTESKTFGIGDFVIFTVGLDREPNQAELWSTDGTIEGTIKVDDIFDDDFLFGHRVRSFGDALLYATDDDGRLQVTDGASTWDAAGISFFDAEDDMPSVKRTRNGLIAGLDDGLHGKEPWILDSDGARLLADLNWKTAKSYFFDAVALSQKLVVEGETEHYDEATSSYVYQHLLLQIPATGDALSSVRLRDGLAASAQLNGELYFSEHNSENRISNLDGDLVPLLGDNLSNFSIDTLLTSDDSIIAVGNNWNESLMQVHRYTPATQAVTELGNVPFPSRVYRREILDLDGALLVVGGTENAGDEIYRVDDAGVTVLTEVNGQILYGVVRAGSHVYFQVQTQAGNQLWKSDGTSDGTQIVYQARSDETFSPRELTDAHARLYFSNGGELWTSDGTPEGTGPALSQPLRDVKDLLLLDDALQFLAIDESDRYGIWRLSLHELKRIPGDADGNNVVDFADFLSLSANYGRREDVVFADGDFDEDGEVGFADFLILSQNFGAKRTKVPSGDMSM